MKKKFVYLLLFVLFMTVLPFQMLEAQAASTSWIEQELDGNEPFIAETEKILSKNRQDITLADLETIQKIHVFGADSIPNKISDYKNLTALEANYGTITEVPESVGSLKELVTLNVDENNLQEFPMVIFQLPKLEVLYISRGNITEIPTEITTLASHLKVLDVSNQKLVTIPDSILTTNWKAMHDGKLGMSLAGNQIASDIPANYLDNFNSGGNMLEFYDNPTIDYLQKQDQLTYTGGTIEVPLNTDFKQLTPDKTNLGLKSNIPLFSQHEFMYYDDGTSANILTNGVATDVGDGYITIKSTLSTNSNPFAKVRVPIKVTAPLKGADVTVQYLDSNGDTLATPDILSGNEGDAYASTPKTIDGYTLTQTPTNAQGTFTEEPQTVIYVYTKNSVAAAPVTVKYLDEEGKILTASDNLTGNVDDPYQTKAKEFAGYTLDESKLPTNASGVFKTNSQTVTYVYKTIPASIKAHDSTMNVGDTWSAKDNFDSAVDSLGVAVPFDEVKVDGSVDTTKSGVYLVTYSFAGDSVTIKVTVKATVVPAPPITPIKPVVPAPANPNTPSTQQTPTKQSGTLKIKATHQEQPIVAGNLKLPTTGDNLWDSVLYSIFGFITVCLSFVLFFRLKKQKNS
ncbi:Internalin-J [Listeria monocytogenes]|uniref:class 1 internalin InlL n=1 Tax=Listeria monocytogenes TaxID=1639 RepID=UPI000E74A3A6|nr:class 1 internalin InlL [Listeria monocytogenes]EKZ4355962.1 class 1 internalin InlL [Listeria monocytogenes]RJZ46675.1 Internalin-J [Listeria monocytogenes]